MLYEEALALIETGKMVKRSTWDGISYVKKTSPNSVYPLLSETGWVGLKISHNTVIPYEPTEEELNATDWIVWGDVNGA